MTLYDPKPRLTYHDAEGIGTILEVSGSFDGGREICAEEMAHYAETHADAHNWPVLRVGAYVAVACTKTQFEWLVSDVPCGQCEGDWADERFYGGA